MATQPTLLADEQAAIQALTNIFSGRDSSITALQGQRDDALTQLAAVQQQLAQVTDDDSSLAAKLAAANAQLQKIAGTEVWDHLEDVTWSVGAGTVANTGTTGSTQTGGQSLPGLTWGKFWINPQGPWADRIYYQHKPVRRDVTTYEYDVSIMFADQANSAACNCIELDILHVIPPFVFDPGLQLDFTEGLWRVWDRTTHIWRSTGVPLKRLAPGQWLNFVLKAHRDDDFVYYDEIDANGQPINIPAEVAKFAKTTEPKESEVFAPGFQLDGNKAGTPYTVNVRNMRFTRS